MTLLSRLAAAALLTLGVAAAPADSPVNVQEPEGFHTGPQQGYTPPTLKGAVVLDIDGLDRVVATGKAVLIDVALADRRPAGMAPDKPWLPAHRSVPGAIWMPNAGAAPLDPAHENLFLARVAELTGGDKARPIVTFCHPDCWGSWNAGKRLVQAGYTAVHWFPTGIEGWQERHETAVLKEDPAWAARSTNAAQR
ncbi:rhodanese-like domain-containing protein [Methylobacterium gossipiicola]|uniref:PQQ-dependent catabolism-associated CXXCW motif protein n=1 Tax=Methylobacterium gossipiicola TaxID=582675 RepID=A0A1I2RTU9_9HYPH|nr:rhodanese-like domain-containing protein [Methylobacterium gossipiicola]SFG43890.1 PQQ-dependent catabolism-associated CXXCW motif protein [Methylobacterium gossipiicola]